MEDLSFSTSNKPTMNVFIPKVSEGIFQQHCSSRRKNMHVVITKKYIVGTGTLYYK